MTSVRSFRARRRRFAGPLAVALLLAVAGFVLALTVGAALTARLKRSLRPDGQRGAGRCSRTERRHRDARAGAVLSAVPQLPALHGVKERKAKKPKRTKAGRPCHPRRATPRRTSRGPFRRHRARASPHRSRPRVPSLRPRHTESPSFVGKDLTPPDQSREPACPR